MKNSISAIVGLAIIFAISSCKDNGRSARDEGTEKASSGVQITLATLKLKNLDGSAYELSSLKGKRVLVNFWATWCKPCLAEMPSMERASKMLSDQNVVILAASDEKLARIEKFRSSSDYTFSIISTEADLSVLEIFALPATFIFDEKGQLVFKELGARDWDSAESIKLIKETNKL